jgi:uncharacterized protein (DUF488 family)
MNKALFTIGYEGMVVEEFIKKLKINNTELLIDVREIPASRKQGFSKLKLQGLLQENNIGYVHYKELGSPKEIRNQLKETNNFVNFFEQYSNYLETQSDYVDKIVEHIASKSSCLFCFERDHNTCHRSIIAKHIKQKFKDIEVINL